jgi:PIN domain nuclease of toxin-antitoxin system
MILLDTHIWVWWVNGSEELTGDLIKAIESHVDSGLGISVISCWEVAKLVERGRLKLTIPIQEWIEKALTYPGIQLLDLTPDIAVESTQLPGEFHRDPADQIIVATARLYNISLLTRDSKLLNYPYMKLLQN